MCLCCAWAVMVVVMLFMCFVMMICCCFWVFVLCYNACCFVRIWLWQVLYFGLCLLFVVCSNNKNMLRCVFIVCVYLIYVMFDLVLCFMLYMFCYPDVVFVCSTIYIYNVELFFQNDIISITYIKIVCLLFYVWLCLACCVEAILCSYLCIPMCLILCIFITT